MSGDNLTTPAPDTTSAKVLARRIPDWAQEYLLPLLLFSALTILLTWPTVRDFSTKLVSSGGDARHNLWVLWHYKEALLGHTAWFSTELLYFPLGASLLTHGLGPVMAFFALPFWPWGATAAHNGATLVGFGLTGYFMYLLARGLGFRRGVALFTGLMLLTAPMHMAGLLGHMTKVFLGLIPLVILGLHHTLNLGRNWKWAIVTALFLLATLLHSGYQFIFTAMLMALYSAVVLYNADRPGRIALLKRGLVLAASCLVIIGPLLFANLRASKTETITVSRNQESFNYQPDAVEFIAPYQYSRFFAEPVREILGEYDVRPSIETTVSLSVTGLLLSLLALLKGKKEGRWWLLFTLIFVVLAMGPALKLFGRRNFTEYGLPVILPYVLVTRLPGLDFMRVPGRFMMVGFVTFAVAASYGLAWLTSRFPRWSSLIIISASLLLLVETWPRVWWQETLRPVPQFYQELATDSELYGVFDLPISSRDRAGYYIGYSSYYQMYQMTHGKGITSGYLSRVYDTHPLFPCVIPEPVQPQPDILVNGEATDCAANFLFELAHFDYRYLVWHRPGTSDQHYKPDSWADEKTTEFVTKQFGNTIPLAADNLVTVYAVPSPAEAAIGLSPVMGLKDNWYSNEEGQRRWAKSPATLFISMPDAQTVTLQITPEGIFDPGPDQVVGGHGMFQVSLNSVLLTTTAITVGETTDIPLDLPAGVHTVTLSLVAGNFQPSDYGSPDFRELSFAIQTINLVVEE